VVIFAGFALLGKSFFHALEVAFAVRVGFRVDFGKVGKKAIGRNFFTDIFARHFRHVRKMTAFYVFTDALRKSNTGFDECVVEVGLGNFYNYRKKQIAKNTRNILELKKFIFCA